jgi:hypothetical protein
LLGVVQREGTAPTSRAVKIDQRQITTPSGFIGAGTDLAPEDCRQALVFTLTDGVLSSSLGNLGTFTGSLFQALTPGDDFDIREVFSVINGELNWFNPAFLGSRASFCQVSGDQIYATFSTPSTFPDNCTPITLKVFDSK